MIRGLFFALVAFGLSVTPGPVPHKASWISSDHWTQVGRGVISSAADKKLGHFNLSGRTVCAAARYDNVQNQKVLWMGTALGGLWKEVAANDGHIIKWIPLTDNFPGPHVLGSFMVHLHNSQKILIGPGGFTSFNGGDGDGMVYRTDDQGAHWRGVALPATDPPDRVNKLAEDTSDNSGETILAATSRGIYRSEDFGDHWTRVFKNISGSSGDEVTDILQDSGDAKIWYAGVAVNGNAIVRSTDKGKTWAPYHPGSNITGTVGRVLLAGCEANKDVLYAMVMREKTNPDDKGDCGGGLNGVWRSLDRGKNWTKIFNDNDAINDGNQGFHAGTIGCDPTDPKHVFIGVQKASESFNATSANPTWSPKSGGESTLVAGHGDYNGVLFRKGLTNMVITSDGGYFIYFKPRTGPSTVDDSGNLLGIDAHYPSYGPNSICLSRSNDNALLAGLVDNGILVGDLSTNKLRFAAHCDGGQVSFMPGNSNNTVASGTTATPRMRSTNGGASYSGYPKDSDTNGFCTMLVDPVPGIVNPNVFTYVNLTNGKSRIDFRKFADTTSPWKSATTATINGKISQIDKTTNANMIEIVFTLSGSPKLMELKGSPEGIGITPLYNITPPHLPSGLSSSSAHANTEKSNKSANLQDTIYYVIGRGSTSYVAVTHDSAISGWDDLTGDIAAVSHNAALYRLVGNPRNFDIYFLATSSGVYRTLDRGKHWHDFSDGLRLNETVREIVIASDGRPTPLLLIFTLGRGIWARELG